MKRTLQDTPNELSGCVTVTLNLTFTMKYLPDENLYKKPEIKE